MAKIMLVGISGRESKRLAKYFETVQLRCETMSTIESAAERIATEPPALVVVEKPTQIETLRSLQRALLQSAPSTPFLVTMDDASLIAALEAMNAGAYDCLSRPFDRLQFLAAAKRAVHRQGRTLFVTKIQKRKNWSPVAALVLGLVLLAGHWMNGYLNGPPPKILPLGTAHLSGIQWQGRSLWVADWYEATVTHHEAKKGLFEKARDLVTQQLFRMQDGQPMAICNTPDALITIGSDLKLRSHQRSVGLPTLQTFAAPGTNPTGLAWDGENLWSCDGQTHLLYRHSSDLRVLETVKSIVPEPMGLAVDDRGIWVLGGNPLKLALLTRKGGGEVWQGPYGLSNLLPEGVTPSGFAVGHGRVWLVSGGDPKMVSRSLEQVLTERLAWDRRKN